MYGNGKHTRSPSSENHMSPISLLVYISLSLSCVVLTYLLISSFLSLSLSLSLCIYIYMSIACAVCSSSPRTPSSCALSLLMDFEQLLLSLLMDFEQLLLSLLMDFEQLIRPPSASSRKLLLLLRGISVFVGVRPQMVCPRPALLVPTHGSSSIQRFHLRCTMQLPPPCACRRRSRIQHAACIRRHYYYYYHYILYTSSHLCHRVTTLSTPIPSHRKMEGNSRAIEIPEHMLLHQSFHQGSMPNTRFEVSQQEPLVMDSPLMKMSQYQ